MGGDRAGSLPLDTDGLTTEVGNLFARAAGIFAERAKQYGTANIAETGVAGVLARIRDKMARAEQLADGENPMRMVDTALDLANYGIILASLAEGTWPTQRREECLVLCSGAENLTTPIHEGDVGYDLRAREDTLLVSGRLTWVSTGVRICQPKGGWCRIAGRSSMLHQHGVIVPDNVIDAGYTGELKIPCLASSGDWQVRAGDRVAQVVFFSARTPRLRCVEVLPETQRGGRGFGSTGA